MGLMKLFLSGRLGIMLLGIWAIAWGAVHVVPALAFNGHGNVLGIVAIVAGVLILMGR